MGPDSVVIFVALAISPTPPGIMVDGLGWLYVSGVIAFGLGLLSELCCNAHGPVLSGWSWSSSCGGT